MYQEQVLRPMEELLEELAPEFGEPKIFRPYRDIRFSHDKTPYKTHIGATLGPTCYVQLSADGLSAGSGRWHLEPAELTRVPGRGRRAGRGRARRDRRRPGAGRGRGARARDAQVRAARVHGRPPADRPAAAQGADHVAALEPRALAVDAGARGEGQGILPNECGRSATGSPRTSASSRRRQSGLSGAATVSSERQQVRRQGHAGSVGNVGELGADAEEADGAAGGERGQGGHGGPFERGGPPLAVITGPVRAPGGTPRASCPPGGGGTPGGQPLAGGQGRAVGDRDRRGRT